MQKLLKKLFAIVTTLTVAGMLIPVGASALTAAELQSQINDLMATLAALQAQLTALEAGDTTTGTTPAACVGITFDRALKIGMSGTDVKCMQTLLNTATDTQLGTTGAGSPGNETLYFGPKTKAGVIKFQEKYASEILASWGLTAGTGFVGSTTRAKLTSIMGSGTVADPTTPTTPTTPTAPGSGLEISVASDTPVAGPVALGAYNVNFTKIRFTAGNDADYTVSKLIIRRSGVSEDNDIKDLKLYEGSTKVGSTQALNTTTHKASFSGLGWTIPAGTSKVLTLIATVNTSGNDGTTGNSIKLGIDVISDVTASGIVTGAPVYGNAMTIAGASVGTLDIDMLATPAATDVISGATDQHVASLKFTASSDEGFDVRQIVLTEIGTSVDSDIQNIVLKYIGTQVGSTVAELTDGVATFEGDALFTIKAGMSKTIDIYVDVASGVISERTIKFEVEDTPDIIAYGQNTGGAVVITVSGSTYTTERSAAQTIKQGTLTINWDTATNPSATSYVVGTEQNVIASFKFSAGSQEPVKVTKLKLNEGGTISDGEYQNVQIYIDSATESTGHVGSISSNTVTFTDSDGLFTVPKSSNTVVKVKVDISTACTNNDTIKFHIGALTNLEMKGGDSDAKIYSDADHLTYSAVDTTAEATEHTVLNKGTLTVSDSPETPASLNVTKGQEDLEILRFRLATEYEAMTVSSIKVRMWNDSDLSDSDSDTAATSTGYVQNIKLYDGDTLIKTVSTPSAGYVNFSTNLNVPKNETKTLKVVVDIPTGSNLEYLAGSVGAYTGHNSVITVGDELTTTGVSSAQDVTETGGGRGNVFTLQTPTLTVAAASSPPAQYMVTNTAQAWLGRLNLTSAYENIKVTTIIITFDDDSALNGGSSADDVFTTIRIKTGDTQIGADKNITDGSTAGRDRVTFDSIENLTINKDQTIALDIYADISTTSSDTNNLDWYVGHSSNTDIVGAGYYSGTAVNSTGGTQASKKTETLASGTLTVSVDADTPVDANLGVGLAGVDGITLSKFKFEALYEDVKVKTLMVALTDADQYTTTEKAGDYNIDKLYLYDGDTLLMTGAPVVSATSTFTKDAGIFIVANGASKVITVKADIFGLSYGSLSGNSPRVYLPNLTSYIDSIGVSSNTSIDEDTGTPNPATYTEFGSKYVYKTNVTVAKNASCPSGTGSAASNAEVFRFDVTADSHADAVLNTVALTISGSADLGTGASGHAYLYKSTDLTNEIAKETYKAITLPAEYVGSTTAVTSTDGAFDAIPVGATVHIYDTSASTVTWESAVVASYDNDYQAGCAAGYDRMVFSSALSAVATATDVIYYQPLQPGSGKLYFGGMAVITGDTDYIGVTTTVASTVGFAPGDIVTIWGYDSSGSETSTASLTVATTTATSLYFDTATLVNIDYDYSISDDTDAKVTKAIVYTNSDTSARNLEEAIAAGTTKTFVVKGDTTGAASTKTIGVSINAAADFVWADKQAWEDGVQKVINARTLTFPVSTTLTY